MTLSFSELRQQIIAWDTQPIRQALVDLVAAGLVTMVPTTIKSEIYRITPAGRSAVESA